MWKTISYVSSVNPDLTDLDIHRLLDYVEHNNNQNNITGVLMYSDGNFFQVIEGEKNNIHHIFKKIKLDSRHHHLIKIFDREIFKTSFSDFCCKFIVKADHYNQDELQEFLCKEESQNPKRFKNVLYIARKFMRLS